MITGKKLTSPAFTYAAVFLAQFTFWVVLFPNTPSVEYGEGKEVSGTALVYLALSFLLLQLRLYMGGGSAPAIGVTGRPARPPLMRFILQWGCMGFLLGGGAAMV